MKKDKKRLTLAVMLAAFASWGLMGCGGGQSSGTESFIYASGAKADNLSEFYYTYENINYNAEYLRYRFYIEEGTPYFYYEKRERPDDYGPTTEEDITVQGTLKLDEEQWKVFAELIEDGEATKRSDSAETGSRGPWLYIYWRDKPDKQLEFRFSSFDKQSEFEAFCAGMAGIE